MFKEILIKVNEVIWHKCNMLKMYLFRMNTGTTCDRLNEIIYKLSVSYRLYFETSYLYNGRRCDVLNIGHMINVQDKG